MLSVQSSPRSGQLPQHASDFISPSKPVPPSLTNCFAFSQRNAAGVSINSTAPAFSLSRGKPRANAHACAPQPDFLNWNQTLRRNVLSPSTRQKATITEKTTDDIKNCTWGIGCFIPAYFQLVLTHRIFGGQALEQLHLCFRRR